MLHRPMSRVWIAGSALLALLTMTAPGRADVFFETAYVPTRSVVALPTSSLLSTSYVVPNSYVVPTSHVVPTSYSTTYLPTSSIYSTGEVYTTSATYVSTYRPFRFRPRRYVERTTYLAAPSLAIEPTSYVVPTSYLLPSTYISSSSIVPTSYLVDSSFVPTSAYCETAPAPPAQTNAVRPSNTGATNTGAAKNGTEGTITSQPSNQVGSSNERQPSGSVDDGTPSTVSPPVPASAVPRAGAGAPQAPLPEPPPVNSGTTPDPNGAGGVQVPEPGKTGGKPGANETTTRSSLRPTYNAARNILRGKVVSFDSGRPEEGVSVIVSSLTKSFTDRPAMTDAFGEFKVTLPDGDWTVKIKMPSGSVLPVASDFLTASNGRVVDGAGRSVKEFLITR